MGWMKELCGTFITSFLDHRAKTKKRTLLGKKTDHAISVYDAVNEGRKNDCNPISDHISDLGRKKLCRALRKKNQFGAHMAIENNPGVNRLEVCLTVLRVASTYLCTTEDASEIIRAATYTMLACR
jgi:hypothetical protein